MALCRVRTTDEYKIELVPDAVPIVHAARKFPIAMESKVRAELQRMEALGVIAKVDHPTDWVNSMVIVPKPSGDIRVCLDPFDLNKAVRREHYRMPTLDDVTPKLSGEKFFTVLDAKSSYWQVPLEYQSSLLTTFNTPCGRYRFLRLPYGIKSASEIFQKRMDKALQGLTKTHGIVDDILVSGASKEEHDKNLHEVLKRTRATGIKLNPDKTQLCKTEVKFFGEILSSEGMKPHPEKVEAVRGMKAPTTKKELEGYLGMFTYLAQYAPSLSEKTHTLRELTRQDTVWQWTGNHEKAFSEIKDLITSSPGPVLQYYDPRKPVNLHVDASQNGLGAVLLQDKGPIAFAFEAMTQAQRNYAQIEKEMLAILHGCERFHHYLFGRRFQVTTDHKPLEAIFKKPLHAVPLRLQRMRLRMQAYDAEVSYTPGKDIPVADTLSRQFLDNADDTSTIDDDIQAYVHMITTNQPVSDQKIQEVAAETRQDRQFQILISSILEGWPDTVQECPVMIREFYNFRDELTYIDGIVYKGEKIVVPATMRKEMLERIHTGHLGIVKCKDRARDVLFWPRMAQDIQRMVENCATCQANRNANVKEPMIPTEVPELPWQIVSTDLFTINNHDYLLVVDYFSKYVEVALLSNTKSRTVITHLKSIFARHGIPMKLISDNGPQYSASEFKEFAKEWGFLHVTSSPLYPQANGLAERTVQSVKNILKKAAQSGKDQYLALLAHRNTPVIDKLSPAQLLMNRRLRNSLPTSKRLMLPTPVDIDRVKENLYRNRMTQKSYYDRGAKAREPFTPGDHVRVKFGSTWSPAVVTQQAATPRSYQVRTENDSVYRRNAQDINPRKGDDSESCNAPTSSQLADAAPTTPPPVPETFQGKTPVCYTSSGRAVFRPSRYDV